MTDFVEIPDDNSSDNEVQEEQQSPTNQAFDDLRTLKSEMEFRGSLLGKTWSELSRIMTRYQTQLIVKHEQLDSSLTGADHFRISQTEQEVKKLRSENEKFHKNVTDLESKLLDKDSEIVTLRTEVHKSRNEVTMKDNLIQKIQGQMAQEALDYQTEITALRDMLETGQGDYSVDIEPVPVSAPQPVKRRRVLMKAKVPLTTMASPVYPRRAPKTVLQSHRVPSSIAPPAKSELSSVSSPIKTEPFQSSCQMAAPSSSQFDQNEMDSSYSGDQTFNESVDSNQEPGFFKVDEVYDDSNSGGMEGLMQGQDPNMLLENIQGSQEQNSLLSLTYTLRAETDDLLPKDFICDICNRGFTRKSDMKRHRTIHTGLSPFQCVICLKTFNRKCNANQHIALVHQRSYEQGLVKNLADDL